MSMLVAVACGILGLVFLVGATRLARLVYHLEEGPTAELTHPLLRTIYIGSLVYTGFVLVLTSGLLSMTLMG